MRTTTIAALAFLLFGCGQSSTSPTDASRPAPRPLSGAFHVVSHFELPAASALPGPAGQGLDLLDGLATNPGGTLFDLADEAGVPAVGTVKDALPQVLEDKLESWMNGYFETAHVNGVPVHAQLVGLNDAIRSILLTWELDSDLDLPVNADGVGDHVPRQLTFLSSSLPVVIPLQAAELTSGRGVRGTVSWASAADADAGNAQLELSDHAMGIPFGRYALLALDTYLARTLAARDLRASLGALIDCTAMAKSVANQCVASLCVGQETGLRVLCEAGLDQAAFQIEEQIRALDYKAIHFQAGVAKGVGRLDPNAATASLDRLFEGRWTVSVDLGEGEKPAKGTFEAAP